MLYGQRRRKPARKMALFISSRHWQARGNLTPAKPQGFRAGASLSHSWQSESSTSSTLIRLARLYAAAPHGTVAPYCVVAPRVAVAPHPAVLPHRAVAPHGAIPPHGVGPPHRGVRMDELRSAPNRPEVPFRRRVPHRRRARGQVNVARLPI